mmetsp:Transcript_14020/g.18274  ORF Transcript_14020/g.18274 Transcript_14020/m.18274 type:complete len:95 (+) Transcript_14020:137-421(+)|eukprot:CAMPEP_0198145900 /NCGR_PEP_ID=MMETSP1443-20131203/26026_1 /TAXON_ID=186043 /ORGANISM="Entomoneis sp., Strain CCMP2396" /LENGTH=94 /DNA_ID=CAMNT_0043809661 /DNA_START=80 /DNA_END=367 /DNA_ORIENTATION=+
MTLPSSTKENEGKDDTKALSECLFSQYMMTVTAVAGTTGYSLYRKPKNGLGMLVVAGAAGTTADLIYGWTVACKPEVSRFLAHRQKEFWGRPDK